MKISNICDFYITQKYIFESQEEPLSIISFTKGLNNEQRSKIKLAQALITESLIYHS